MNFYVSSVLTNENIGLYEEYKKIEDLLSIEIAYGIDVGASFNGYEEVRKYELQSEHIKSLEKFINMEIGSNVNNELRCSAGKSKIAIDSQGNVMPCIKVRKKVGNILKDNIDEIWNSNKLIEITKNELVRDEKCNNCNKKSYCEAYCPAEYALYENDIDRCKTAKFIAAILNK